MHVYESSQSWQQQKQWLLQKNKYSTMTFCCSKRINGPLKFQQQFVQFSPAAVIYITSLFFILNPFLLAMCTFSKSVSSTFLTSSLINQFLTVVSVSALLSLCCYTAQMLLNQCHCISIYSYYQAKSRLHFSKVLKINLCNATLIQSRGCKEFGYSENYLTRV